MEMLQELYYFPSSPVCRSVIMTAHQLGVQLNLKLVNLLASEQMDPDFVKMNPQHKVPLLCDQGFYLTESRAICIYLVQKYARNDSLYPNDVQQRATVDQRLHFDADIFFRRFAKLYDPVLLSEEVKQLDPEAEKDFQTAIGWLDIILQDHLYVAGDHLTIADLVLLTTAASAAVKCGTFLLPIYLRIYAFLFL